MTVMQTESSRRQPRAVASMAFGAGTPSIDLLATTPQMLDHATPSQPTVQRNRYDSYVPPEWATPAPMRFAQSRAPSLDSPRLLPQQWEPSKRRPLASLPELAAPTLAPTAGPTLDDLMQRFQAEDRSRCTPPEPKLDSHPLVESASPERQGLASRDAMTHLPKSQGLTMEPPRPHDLRLDGSGYAGAPVSGFFHDRCAGSMAALLLMLAGLATTLAGAYTGSWPLLSGGTAMTLIGAGWLVHSLPAQRTLATQ